ncbi:MAG: prepilin peptidase [Patescibacteria group bacterium]
MEKYLLYFFVFVLGTIIGSFLNVVILRFKKNSLNGSSSCPRCKKNLRWFELIPVLSFLFLKGRCRYCQKKISWQYPLVEIATGLLFLFSFIFSAQGGSALGGQFFINLIILWVVFSLLVVIFVYDLYHKIIPNIFVYLFILFSFLKVIITFQNFSFGADIWAGFLVSFPFAFLWFVSGGRWLGFGDVKLALGIGWFLGLVQGSTAVILAVWMGALVGLILVGLTKLSEKHRLFFRLNNFTIKSELPFAPFLILGIVITFFFDLDVWGLGALLHG